MVTYDFDFEKGLLIAKVKGEHALGAAELALHLKWEGILAAAVAATSTKFDDEALKFVLPLLKAMEK